MLAITFWAVSTNTWGQSKDTARSGRILFQLEAAHGLLQRDGLLVGVNWAGARATGFDMAPTQVAGWFAELP